MQGCLFCRRAQPPVDAVVVERADGLTAPAPPPEEAAVPKTAAMLQRFSTATPAGAPELLPFGQYYAEHFRQLDQAAFQSIYSKFPPRSSRPLGNVDSERAQHSFSVVLSRKANEPLGVDLDYTDGFSARLTRIERRGIVLEWNKRCPEHLQIFQGDHIVAVNGVKGSAVAFMQRLQSDAQLEVEVHRPRQFTARVSTLGSLGIDTRQAKNAKSLMISNVLSSGAVSTWNASNKDRTIRKYDRIVAVNGHRGTWKDLSQKVRDSQDLVLLIAEAPPSVERVAEISSATADRLVGRGTSVRQLLSFYAACRRRGALDGATTSLEVLRDIIIPETAGRPCCYMEGEFMQQLGGPRRASRIVSHRRSASFTNLVANVILDATGWNPEDLAQSAFGHYSMRRVVDQAPAERCVQAEALLRALSDDVLAKSYWICLFAVDQHAAACGDCPRCRSSEAWKCNPALHLRAPSCLVCGAAKSLPCPCGTAKVGLDRPDCELNKFGALAKRAESVMVSLDPDLSALRNKRVISEASCALRLRPVRFRVAFVLQQEVVDRLRGHMDLVPHLDQREAPGRQQRRSAARLAAGQQQEQGGGGAPPEPCADDRLVNCAAGLKFGGCRGLVGLPEGARRALEKVKYLEMDFTWMGAELKRISDTFGDSAGFDTLQLERLQLMLDRCKEVHDLEELSKALRGQTELRSLDASFRFCYKLGDSAVASFAAGLPQTLTDLDLNFCFCVHVGNEGLAALAERLPGSLRRLQLNFASCDGLTDSGVASLARRLPSELRSLDLTFSWIGDGGMSALAAGMPQTLEELEVKCSLGNVNLTDSGLAALASRLPGGLRRINLTLAHTGASMAAQALGSSVQGLRDWRPKARPADPARAWQDGPAAPFKFAVDDDSQAQYIVVHRRTPRGSADEVETQMRDGRSFKTLEPPELLVASI